jgi:hypothetical protein
MFPQRFLHKNSVCIYLPHLHISSLINVTLWLFVVYSMMLIQWNFTILILGDLYKSQIFSLCQIKRKSSPTTHLWRCRGERMYSSYTFTTLELDGGEWSASRPDRALPLGKGPPNTHCTGGWVGPNASLDTEARGETSCLCPGSNFDRPVIQSIARH